MHRPAASLRVIAREWVRIGLTGFGRPPRGNERARRFLDGPGPAAIGAILGSAVTLADALSEGCQAAVVAGAAVALLVVRRSVVETLVAAGGIGAVLALAGALLP
jgi:chromate transporter